MHKINSSVWVLSLCELFLNKRLQFVFTSTPVLAAELDKQGLAGFLGSLQKGRPLQSVGTPGELSGALQIPSPACILLSKNGSLAPKNTTSELLKGLIL